MENIIEENENSNSGFSVKEDVSMNSNNGFNEKGMNPNVVLENQAEVNEDKRTKKEVYDKKNLNSNFIMDINFLERAFYSKKEHQVTASSLLNAENANLSKNLKGILEIICSNGGDSKVDLITIDDSAGNRREILATSSMPLPRDKTLDVLFALIGLYINQNSPVKHSRTEEGAKRFELNEDTVYFDLREVCDYMNLTYCGKNLKYIKDSIRELVNVKYYSLEDGYFYDKKSDDYVISTSENSISLGYKHSFREKGSSDSSWFKFSDDIINNIKHNFIKILDDKVYFSLKCGIERHMYSYITGNSYNKGYLKRSFDFFERLFRIPHTQPYLLKKRLKTCLEKMVAVGVINDFFFGSELIVNGKKENCVYLVLKGTKAEIYKAVCAENKEDRKIKMEFPENIEEKLKSYGINDKGILQLKKLGKYKLAEYILWMDTRIADGKVKDTAGLFVAAARDKLVDVSRTHPDIIKFVEKHKAKEEGTKDLEIKLIKEAYDKYVHDAIEDFKDSIGKDSFIDVEDSILGEMLEVKEKRVKSQVKLMNMATTEEQKDGILAIIEDWEEVARKKKNSKMFKEQLFKKIKISAKFMDFDEFKIKYDNAKN